VAAVGLALIGLTWLLTARVHLPPAQGAGLAAMRLTGIAWLVFAGAVWLLRSVPARAAVVLVLLGSAAVGVAAASGPQRTSDDLYRYVWDGQVQAAGIDPYQYVPASAQLEGLRGGFLWPDHKTNWCVGPGTANPDGGALVPGCTLINRPAVHTIYPPVSEAYFLAVHELSPPGSRYKPIQLAGALVALLTTLVLLLGLRALRRDVRLAALWGWSPLVAFEAGNGAHVDVLGALFTVGGLAVLAAVAARGHAGARGFVLGAALLGLAVGAKLTPALAVVPVLRRRLLLVGATVAGTFAVGYVPHVLAVGSKVIGFIPGYIHEQGYATGGGYMLLSLIMPDTWTAPAAGAIVALAAIAVLRTAEPDRPWRGALVLTGVTMFVTTPVFAWYAIPICALVALDGRVEWLSLALSVEVAMTAKLLGIDGVVAQRIGYGQALVVVAAATYVRWRRSRRPEASKNSLLISIYSTAAAQETAVSIVDVVLPCLDEAGALPYLLGRMPDGYRAIVVDNGSTDGSAQIAARLGALVVTEPRRGFGAACHAGLLAATAPVVCFCDCDGSLDPLQLPRVAGPVLAGEADLVLGRRRPLTPGAWPAHARLANGLLAFRLRRSGVRVRDLGPMRAARREALLGLGVRDRRSGYPLETVLAAAHAGWKITETGVDYAPRTGKSKVTGTLSGTVQAVRDMNRVWREAAR
jgi:hypothetical protein